MDRTIPEFWLICHRQVGIPHLWPLFVQTCIMGDITTGFCLRRMNSTMCFILIVLKMAGIWEDFSRSAIVRRRSSMPMTLRFRTFLMASRTTSISRGPTMCVVSGHINRGQHPIIYGVIASEAKQSLNCRRPENPGLARG